MLTFDWEANGGVRALSIQSGPHGNVFVPCVAPLWQTVAESWSNMQQHAARLAVSFAGCRASQSSNSLEIASRIPPNQVVSDICAYATKQSIGHEHLRHAAKATWKEAARLVKRFSDPANSHILSNDPGQENGRFENQQVEFGGSYSQLL